ncbi:hypothetical protein L249_3861 [Ophiocordyceps polyrhachis-furcata BCC 54312]|uniref:T6SS Phospholipase effector Tle1-like catalytic domain-containing protein n=1 Tax=Ophiocordyceps polyrhachis-furcata BCC 54312 TaxID=1330021 RepID=A0A367L502_9HYPO|nr:hypothetical protein L249_3861 [Ophiocordyceps polyrhachis-furcata BCC 54312]
MATPRLLDPARVASRGSPHHHEGEYDDEDIQSGGTMSPHKALSCGGGAAGGGGQRRRGVRKLVLCFDGTGNKFHGDESDSNILKIFRMLDRTAADQYHYYQPGIGTYVVSGSLSHTGVKARINSWYTKAKDSAVGSSFDQHVVGGYRFLMRFYVPGDEIYMFGFSRGAYIARFLAEMLDHIGLLSHGNEEMVKFAWKAFAQWQSRRGRDEEAAKKANALHDYIRGFRETFSRPVGRIRFLGLFDTVNSVPRFETAWMQRSKFPYTARSSARVIRHAVSIDERRAKFRQDLMYQSRPTADRHRHRHRRHLHLHHHHHHHHHHLHDLFGPLRRSIDGHRPAAAAEEEKGRQKQQQQEHHQHKRRLSASNSRYAPYRPRSAHNQMLTVSDVGDAMSCASMPTSDAGPDDEPDEQDIDEVWFAGGHGDVGGGWEALDGRKSTSHVPLAWIVREAIRAGLPFDADKVRQLGCMHDAAELYATGAGARNKKTVKSPNPDIRVEDESTGGGRRPVEMADFDNVNTNVDGAGFEEQMHKAHTSRIHDSLVYGGGLGVLAVTGWKVMELMPFRRMDLQHDGSWKPIRWPLPRGEVRDVPPNVRVHGSVIRRLQQDETYRPGNLIIGGGGRGVRTAPAEYGIGEWVRDVPPNVRVHGSVIRRLQQDETYRPGNLIIGGGGRGVRTAPAEYGIGEWMPLPFIFHVIENGPPEWLSEHRWLVFYLSLSVVSLVALKRWTAGRSNEAERPLHGKVVLFTGGTSGVGAQAARELAARGAQLVLLTREPPSDPFLADHVQDLRDATGNQLIYAEQVDLASLHSIRTFATKWIDNAPPRRLDMIVLCAAALTPPGGERCETEEGIEHMWMVNFVANFHLLAILSPAIKAQPFDRDVRIIMTTCSSYITSPSLRESISTNNWSASTAYARSKLALNVFGQAFQKHLMAYKRPDQLPMNARVIFVDPGLSRTPSSRTWLTRGSLTGLALYLTFYAVPWFLLKSPYKAAQSLLHAAMDPELGRVTGGRLIKECSEVDFARAEVWDEAVGGKLWEETDALIERVEKEQAKRRGAEKARRKRREEEEEERRKADEVGSLVEAIRKGKEAQKRQKGTVRRKESGS